jgi:hypothetical protein
MVIVHLMKLKVVVVHHVQTIFQRVHVIVVQNFQHQLPFHVKVVKHVLIHVLIHIVHVHKIILKHVVDMIVLMHFRHALVCVVQVPLQH